MLPFMESNSIIVVAVAIILMYYIVRATATYATEKKIGKFPYYKLGNETEVERWVDK